MATSQKSKWTIAVVLAALPVVSMADVVGGTYAPPTNTNNQGSPGANGLASGAGAVVSQAQAGAAIPGAKPAPASGSNAPNASAVSSILHPGSSGGGRAVVYSPPVPMTFEDTRDIVINNSINAYTDYCACPYSRNRDGYECGIEAAYYKPGGFRIYCYPEDVRGQLEIFYRKTH